MVELLQSGPPPADAEAVELLTALHIGAGSVSMMVAEFHVATGVLTPVDFLEQPAQLASDVFGTGRVGAETTERIISIIKGYQGNLADLGVDPHSVTRAVATNILSEATNVETVMNRVRIACGLRVSVIDDGEMTRLIYLKTRRRLQDVPLMHERSALVVHVGPGNTRALLFQEGLITRYTSYRLGTHRTREVVEDLNTEGPALQRVIREHASGNLSQLKFDFSDIDLDAMVMIGYEIQSVAGSLVNAAGTCSVKALREFTTRAAAMTDSELVKRYQLDYQTAEALVASLEINLGIAETLGVSGIHIPRSDYEQGLLHDLLVSRDLSDRFAEEVLHSARILGARYQSDPSHGEHVAQLCEHFFKELQDLHQMDAHDALLLKVAAILHEVGTYVSPRAHHKHSEYIILNSEIFGLDRLDVTVVALVSRYHRHSCPKLDHPTYAALGTDDRIRVSKLAAILRVADALERTHAQRIGKIELEREGRVLRIRLPGVSDASVERLAMAGKADLFTEVFGLEVIVDEK